VFCIDIFLKIDDFEMGSSYTQVNGISLHLLKFPRPVPVGLVKETVTLGQLSLSTFLSFH